MGFSRRTDYSRQGGQVHSLHGTVRSGLSQEDATTQPMGKPQDFADAVAPGHGNRAHWRDEVHSDVEESDRRKSPSKWDRGRHIATAATAFRNVGRHHRDDDVHDLKQQVQQLTRLVEETVLRGKGEAEQQETQALADGRNVQQHVPRDDHGAAHFQESDPELVRLDAEIQRQKKAAQVRCWKSMLTRSWRWHL